MLAVSNSTVQTLNPGQSSAFDTVLLHTGCAECYNPTTGLIGLKAGNAIYDISFDANIGGTEAGDAQIGITIDGEPIKQTIAMVVTATAGDLQHVSGGIFLPTCCPMPNVVRLTNTGTTEINLGANPVVRIKRIA